MNNLNKEKHLMSLLFQNKLNADLQPLLECIQDGIFITDGTGDIIACNQTSMDYCHATKDYVIGKNVKELVEEGIFQDSVVLETIRQRKTVSMLQQALTDKRDLLVTATPFFKGDDISFIVLTERDMSDLISLQSQLAELDEKYEHEIDYYRNKFLLSPDIIGDSPEIKSIINDISRIAPTDATVLLQGESGTGKSLFAKFIHNNSLRSKYPFIEINCGAIPEPLLESELFGYEKGAFTGASDKGKPGLFELANSGTLFLDEIGTLPLGLQAKLLRAIQEKEIMRVGGTKYIPIDIRIIAASNISLSESVNTSTFRKDLYYRLNICQITLPPLADRPSDIILLSTYFLNELNSKYKCNKHFTASAQKLLCAYDWPGNIRELENMIERIVILSDDDDIKAESISILFPLSGLISNTSVVKSPKITIDLKREVESFEKKIISSKIKSFNSLTELSDALSIDKSTALRKLKKYNLHF